MYKLDNLLNVFSLLKIRCLTFNSLFNNKFILTHI